MNTKIEEIALIVLIVLGLILLVRLVFVLIPDGFVKKPKLKVTLIKGDNMALVYGFSCEAPVDGDVSERRLSVSVNDKDPVVSVFDASATDLGEFTFTHGDSIVLSLVDVDDVGNVSEPAVVEFVAADTIPPSVPGGFTVSLLREEDTSPVDNMPDPPDLETT